MKTIKERVRKKSSRLVEGEDMLFMGTFLSPTYHHLATLHLPTLKTPSRPHQNEGKKAKARILSKEQVLDAYRMPLAEAKARPMRSVEVNPGRIRSKAIVEPNG